MISIVSIASDIDIESDSTAFRCHHDVQSSLPEADIWDNF